ncbi:YhcH/YjgK/YiaL family protein [Lachnospiraceae bacterium 54-53]
MIFGNICNPMLEQQLAVLPKPLRSAILFLKNNDMAAHEPGVFHIRLDGLPVILQVLDLKTSARENLRPEIHRRNIDVQFLAGGGPELAGFYSDDGTGETDEDLLHTPRDILFYKNNPQAEEGRIHLVPGTYAVYFPWDVHIPAIQAGKEPAAIRKIVLKVPLESCLTAEKDQGDPSWS